MKPESLRKIALALRQASPWPLMLRRLRVLSAEEVAEAERIERLGKRRVNMLMALKAERGRRAGQPEKMLRLKVEGRV